jgi:hypothetical protein
LKKEIKDNLRRRKDLPCSWTGGINIMKMAILPKAIYMLNAIPIKIPHRDLKINPKFHLEAQKTTNNQSNTEQKSNAGGITIPDFKLYYRAIALKTSC